MYVQICNRLFGIKYQTPQKMLMKHLSPLYKNISRAQSLGGNALLRLKSKEIKIRVIAVINDHCRWVDGSFQMPIQREMIVRFFVSITIQEQVENFISFRRCNIEEKLDIFLQTHVFNRVQRLGLHNELVTRLNGHDFLVRTKILLHIWQTIYIRRSNSLRVLSSIEMLRV